MNLSDYLFYQDNWATIYCGDCLEILPLMEPESVDLVVTDPQYTNPNIKSKSSGRGGKLKDWNHKVPVKDWDEIYGSDQEFDPTPLLTYRYIVLWGANYYANKLPPHSKWLIWDKRGNIRPDDNSDCEIAWTNQNGASRIFKYLWKGVCREGEENIVYGPKFHPLQKPVALMEWCIRQFNVDGRILDPFLGSGTTCVASKNLNRKSIGIEINPKYCEIAVKRLRQEVFDFRKATQ